MIHPYFSIIIRFYNAERWLATAIESVLRQSFKDWELLLVNDCSKDKGSSIAHEYEVKYDKIHLISLAKNSGNAKKPGDVGVSNAKGKFTLFLDSDDELEEKYLEKFFIQLEKTNADIVLPIMDVRDSSTKKHCSFMPLYPFNPGYSMIGKEACSLTLPTYQIGCNGMAFRTTLYKYVEEQNAFYYMNSDEMSERILLYCANLVVASDAIYTYWLLESSITHKLSPKLFEILVVDEQLMCFAKERYDDTMCKAMFKTNLSHLFTYQKKYFMYKKDLNTQERSVVKSILRQSYRSLQNNVDYASSCLEKLVLSNYCGFMLLCRINLILKGSKR